MQVNSFKPTKQSAPNFGAKIKFEAGTQQFVERNLANFYNNCEPLDKINYFGKKHFNAEKSLNKFKYAFNNMTKDIEGTLSFAKSDEMFFNDTFCATFVDKNKTSLEVDSSIAPIFAMTQNKKLDKGKPFSTAVRHLLSIISEAHSLNGNSFCEENEFNVLLKKLQPKNISRPWANQNLRTMEQPAYNKA